MTPLLSLEDAWERLFSLIEPVETESIDTADAGGRFLAIPLAARRAHPFADLSAMDGFATCGSGPWVIGGESRAGSHSSRSLAPGQAVHISTGAEVPPGADGILPLENASLKADTLHANSPPESKYIRRKGFDFDSGDALLSRGTAMTSPRIALARLAGYSHLEVLRRPVVAIIECGDELVTDAENCPPDKLPAANGAMVAHMARQAGAKVLRGPPAPDDLEQMAHALQRHSHADLAVTIGGASVGKHDLVKPALEAIGADIGFWRVAIRPGKPLLVATHDKRLFLGLPGNPVSSFVTALLFMVPAIKALQRALNPKPRPVSLPLDGTLGKGSTRREFRRAVVTPDGVRPLEERDSSAILSLSQAELLIDRPIDAPPVAKGTMVPCYLLDNGAMP